MKFLIVAILSCIAFQVLAAEPKAKVTGVLLVDFERDEAYFFPDEKSIKTLSNYSENPTGIFIGNGKQLLNQILSKKAVLELLINRQPTFEAAAVVTIRKLHSQIACDTKEYKAELVSVTLLRNKATEVITHSYGC